MALTKGSFSIGVPKLTVAFAVHCNQFWQSDVGFGYATASGHGHLIKLSIGANATPTFSGPQILFCRHRRSHHWMRSLAALDDLFMRDAAAGSKHTAGHLDRATLAARPTKDALEFGAIEAFGQNRHVDQDTQTPAGKVFDLSFTITGRRDHFGYDARLAEQQIQQVALGTAMKEGQRLAPLFRVARQQPSDEPWGVLWNRVVMKLAQIAIGDEGCDARTVGTPKVAGPVHRGRKDIQPILLA